MFEKTTWADGEMITADKMNNIEDGVSFINAENIGKNLLHNGKPHVTIADWNDSYPDPVGWTRTGGSSSKVQNLSYELLAGQYIHATFDAKVVSSKAGLIQFEKEYRKNGVIFGNGEAGGEIKDIIGGQDVTLSLEVKANQPVYVHKQLMIQYNDNSKITVLDGDTSVVTPPVVLPEDGWKKLTTTDTMPDEWQSMVDGENVKWVVLMINIYLRDLPSALLSNVEYWVRNVKLEYGTHDTGYTYSDWDVQQIITKKLTEVNA